MTREKKPSLSPKQFAETHLGRKKPLAETIVPAVVTAVLVMLGIAAIQSRNKPEDAIAAATVKKNPCITDPDQDTCRNRAILNIRQGVQNP